MKKAFQFLAYRSKSSLLGAHTTLINTNAAHLGSKSLNVKAVLLEEGEFSQEAVKSIIESKASGIVALVPNQSFVPSEKWSQAYDYLLENGKNIPTYFAVKSDEVAGLARRVKKNTTTKVIAEKKLGSGSSKQKFVDIIVSWFKTFLGGPVKVRGLLKEGVALWGLSSRFYLPGKL